MAAISVNVKKYLIAAALFWTVLIVSLLSLHIDRDKQQALEFARVQARSALHRDLSYRRWNASYGGLYAPVSESLQSNPYLNVPKRDVVTTDGIALTLINPAYMTRQVHEMNQEQYGERGHITSLNPIRPQNAPDEWETRILQGFESNAAEFSEVVNFGNAEYMRVMIPLIAEQSCLTCHSFQGYKLGDIRGGLSVSVPLSPYLSAAQTAARQAAINYGLLWGIGIAGILAAGRRMNRQVEAQRRAEEEIHNLNAHLEQCVEERARQLRDAQEKLMRQEKMAMLGQMAGGVGHELRNPLGIISNAVYFLKLSQPDAVEKVKEYLDLIEVNVRVSEKIINDLLGFTNLKPLAVASISIPAVIQKTLERFPPPSEVRLVLQLPADLPNARADLQHVIQVLGNLYMNACQAVAAVTHEGSVTISAFTQGDMVAVTVADNGVGISPENMKKLFEPLFTTKPKGIGLGLAVSKRLIEANKGRIEVKSEAGVGSAFTIYLPLTAESRHGT